MLLTCSHILKLSQQVLVTMCRLRWHKCFMFLFQHSCEVTETMLKLRDSEIYYFLKNLTQLLQHLSCSKLDSGHWTLDRALQNTRLLPYRPNFLLLYYSTTRAFGALSPVFPLVAGWGTVLAWGPAAAV